MIELIGGPFDGASGPHPQHPGPVLWFRADPESKGPNGLVVTGCKVGGAVPYVREDAGRYRYGDDGSRERGPALEAVA